MIAASEITADLMTNPDEVQHKAFICFKCDTCGKDEICPKCKLRLFSVPCKISKSKKAHKRKHKGFISAREAHKIRNNNKKIKGYEFLGKLPKKLSIMLWGSPGSGKSTYSVGLANSIASKNSPTLYISSEEGEESESMKEKLVIQNADSEYLYIRHEKDSRKILDLYRESKAKNLFIDSISMTDITPKMVEDVYRQRVKGMFSYVLHATKDGNYKGDTGYQHVCDISARVHEGVVETDKNRFSKLAKHRIFGEEDDEKSTTESNS